MIPGRFITCLIFTIIFNFSLCIVNAQQNDSLVIPKQFKHSFDIGPMGDIFILQYGYTFSRNNEIIVGLSYTNPSVLKAIKYPGYEEILTLELGYRRYLWKHLHAEIQLDPQYFKCQDTIANKIYHGFGITTEIRFGYRFDFEIAQIPFFLNLQLFSGFHIINPKPKSFQNIDKGSMYISPIPMFFLGYKF